MIDNNKIEPEIFKILSPFLEELSEIPDGLSFNDFCVAMDNLMSILSQDEKSKILNTHKKRKESYQNFSFKPVINESPNHSREGSIYDRCLNITQSKNDKIRKAKEEKMTQESNKCTFKPNTTPYKAEKSITKKYYQLHHDSSHPCIGLCSENHI